MVAFVGVMPTRERSRDFDTICAGGESATRDRKSPIDQIPETTPS